MILLKMVVSKMFTAKPPFKNTFMAIIYMARSKRVSHTLQFQSQSQCVKIDSKLLLFGVRSAPDRGGFDVESGFDVEDFARLKASLFTNKRF